MPKFTVHRLVTNYYTEEVVIESKAAAQAIQKAQADEAHQKYAWNEIYSDGDVDWKVAK